MHWLKTGRNHTACAAQPHFSLRANRGLNLPQPDKNSVPKDNFRVLRVYDCPGLQSYQNVSRETLLSDWAAKSDKTDAKSITVPERHCLLADLETGRRLGN
jgi:hypothetical protein